MDVCTVSSCQEKYLTLAATEDDCLEMELKIDAVSSITTILHLVVSSFCSCLVFLLHTHKNRRINTDIHSARSRS